MAYKAYQEWNCLDLPEVDQDGQRLLVVFLDFIGTLGAVNNVSQISMDVSRSVRETGFSFERAMGIVGKGSLP